MTSAGKKTSRKKNEKSASTKGHPSREDPIVQEMKELAAQVYKHQRLYYIQNEPEISDYDFDQLLKRLQELEHKHPHLALPDSPTRIVGSDLENDFEKVEHSIPVLSLANTYSTNEALDWANKTLKEEKSPLVVQWKVDGATLVLTYEKGKLVRALTRGSGQIGDDVTANALTIRNIPHTLKEPEDVVTRGEVYMTFQDFETFNRSHENQFANPRNLTSGSLKHKKSSEVALRPLRWVAFEGVFPDKNFETDREILDHLKNLGLPVFQDHAFIESSTDLETMIQEFDQRRRGIDFPVDGLVIKIDRHDIRRKLGSTAHSPRWAISLKFEPESAHTRVQKIEVFTGRTGRVTPRAKLEPVPLAGTTVSYATLHNSDYIHKLDVREGSLVKVSKRGEIIPAVEEVIERGDSPPYTFPDRCPTCSTVLVRETSAADFLCPNVQCDARLINRLIFFCQRKQMDIGGLGEKVIETLFEKKFIRHIIDIYTLHHSRQKLQELEGFGEKSVQLLLEGIERSRTRSFRKVLPSLGYREIGPSVTDILFQNGYTSMEQILELASNSNAKEILEQMNGIGPRTSAAIIEQMTDPDIQKEIHDLKGAGLSFSVEESFKSANQNHLPPIFEGQTWCVTGSFQNFSPRELALEEIEKRGGKTSSRVSSKTTHLLAGEKGGSKLEKAKKVGAQIISENEFLKMLHGAEENK